MVVKYLRERFRLRLYLPLALVIAAAAIVPPASWKSFAIDFVVALLLMVQFRMWDDLADRDRDRIEHPGRVLVRDSEGTQIVGLCGALAVLNICLAILRDHSGIAVGVLAVLTAALGIWYLARTRRSVAGEQLLLAKYPAMVGIVAGSRVFEAPVQILSAASLLYLIVCVYEAWHDPASPLARLVGGHS